MTHYTTIEQSKKLEELGLNSNTADMLWEQHLFEIPYVTVKPYTTKGRSIGSRILPCWSIGALIRIMPSMISYGQYDSTLGIYKYGEFRVCYQNMHHTDEVWYTKGCLLDAIFEMVCWLLKNGYIEKGGTI